MGLINKKIKLDDFAKEVTKSEKEAANIVTLIQDHILNSSLPIQYYNGDFKQIKPKKIQITEADNGYEIKFQGGGKNYLHLYLKKQKTGYSLQIPPAEGNDLQLVNPEVIQRFVKQQSPEVYEIFNILRQAMQEQLKIHEQARIQKQKFHDGKLPYKNLLPYMKKVIGFKIEKEKKIESTKEETSEKSEDEIYEEMRNSSWIISKDISKEQNTPYEGMSRKPTKTSQRTSYLQAIIKYYQTNKPKIEVKKGTLVVQGTEIHVPNALKGARNLQKKVNLRSDGEFQLSGHVGITNNPLPFMGEIGHITIAILTEPNEQQIVFSIYLFGKDKNISSRSSEPIPIDNFSEQNFQPIQERLLQKAKQELEAEDKQ